MSNVSITTAAIYQAVLDSLNSSGECGVLPPAPPGKSAYEVAVDNGFVGSENQWLNSLTIKQEQEIARLEARIVSGEKFTKNTNYAASRLVGDANGNVPEIVGVYGVGGWGIGGVANSGTYGTVPQATGFYKAAYNDALSPTTNASAYLSINVSPTTSVKLAINQVTGNVYTGAFNDGELQEGWARIYSTKNTTKEAGTGYLVASSPVLKVQHDSFEKVHEAGQLDIDVQHVETGVYAITGTTGLRDNDGWNLKPPKDVNGNVLCICEATQDGDVITLKTYKKEFDFETVSIVADYEQPTNIPEGAEVMLRFNDLPQEELYEPVPEEEPIVDEVVEPEVVEEEVPVEEDPKD